VQDGMSIIDPEFLSSMRMAVTIKRRRLAYRRWQRYLFTAIIVPPAESTRQHAHMLLQLMCADKCAHTVGKAHTAACWNAASNSAVKTVKTCTASVL
jgi:hypothetical protein